MSRKPTLYAFAVLLILSLGVTAVVAQEPEVGGGKSGAFTPQATCASGTYDPLCDVGNNNGEIDVADIQRVAGNFGSTGTYVEPGGGSDHSHLGQTWTGIEPLRIEGSIPFAALIIANDDEFGGGMTVERARTGFRVIEAPNHGFYVDHASNGLYVDQVDQNGVYVYSATSGLQVDRAYTGVYVISATNGLWVQNATSYGVSVVSATNGLNVQNATNRGVSVGSAPTGLRVDNAASSGVSVGSASTGLRVDNAASAGVSVGSAPTGFHVSNASFNAFHADNAFLNGLYVVNAFNGVLVVSATNGLQVGNASSSGVSVESASTGLNVLSSTIGVRVVTATNNAIDVNAAENGVLATSSGHAGVNATGRFNGVIAEATGENGNGIKAVANNGSSAYAVWGVSADGRAGHFDGDVNVNGALAKSSGTFKIDHPLDPTNKYLYHSFVESPDMMNIYNGNVVLDAEGTAVVEMPEWFEALNQEFRYQLTSIGAPGPNLYIAEKISGNQFKIAGGTPGAEVSWQVTGIRHDPWAEKNRVQVEEQKPAAEQGTYLYPEGYGQPETLGVNYKRMQEAGIAP